VIYFFLCGEEILIKKNEKENLKTKNTKQKSNLTQNFKLTRFFKSKQSFCIGSSDDFEEFLAMFSLKISRNCHDSFFLMISILFPKLFVLTF
jgi:hypothetical protein